MNVFKLKVDGSLPGDLTFEMTSDGQVSSQFQTQVDFTLEKISTEPTSLGQLLPPRLTRALRQWILDDPLGGLLAISSVDPYLEGIPWEYLPQILELPTVFIVRLLEQSGHILKGKMQDRPRILAAGWSGKPWLDLPGIQKELNSLSQLGVESEVHVRVLSEPSPTEFAEAYGAIQPLILHLIPPALRNENQMPEMILSEGEDIKWVRIDNFLSQLPTTLRPRLVVINSCHSGKGNGKSSAIRVVTEHLGSIAVGWLGEVQDISAVDFALFFYTRLLEGGTVIEALRSYKSLNQLERNPEKAFRDVRPIHLQERFKPIPVVLTPSLDLLTESLLETLPETSEQEVSRKSPSRSGLPPTTRDSRPPQRGTPSNELGYTAPAEELSPLTIDMEFEPQSWLNPALMKNGRPAIVQLTLNPERSLTKVSLAITCDTGHGSSTIRQTINLERGHQPVSVDAFQFPILYQLMQDNVSRRQINFTITCRLGTVLLAETTKSALWMGRAEWLDRPDTWHFIPAFVEPNADGVLNVIDKSVPILKTLETPESAFSGYQMGDKAFVMKQAEALFNCLRDPPFNLNYINPPPLPVFTPGDDVSSGQHVRSPNEVIERKRGTCHDLAVFFASCLEHIGIYPLIFLIQGHTFVGFWNDSKKHQEFWYRARKDIMRQTKGPGRAWTIADQEEIRLLVQQGSISCMEATMVTNRNAQFMKAIQKGNENLDSPRKFDIAIDIQASRSEIQPL